MPYIDPHTHMISRTTDDYEAMAANGIVAVIEPAFWIGQARTNVGSYGESWGGYVAGTGRPLRFVDEDGTVVDCFQQPHLVYDDLTVLERLRDDTEAEVARMVAWIDEICGEAE